MYNRITNHENNKKLAEEKNKKEVLRKSTQEEIRDNKNNTYDTLFCFIITIITSIILAAIFL